jgi:ribosomal protein S18 acetylase RimI-like enzyme
MRTSGSQIVTARVNELRRVLLDLSAQDLSQLDPSVGAGMDRPLGRELLATRLPVSDSTYVCLYNLEPSGLIVLHRSRIAARIRALAVSPDQRRKGLARTLLIDAEERVQEKGMRWLWMLVPATNVEATRCALSCGFKRYRPQYLYRNIGRTLMIETRSVYLQPATGADATRAITDWFGQELQQGDSWAQPVVEEELLSQVLPETGEVWRCIVNEREIGCAHLTGPVEHPAISLWLDRAAWNTPEEAACLRAVLSTMAETPPEIDLWLGSGDHLRASVSRYKALDFKPKLAENVIFVKDIPIPSEE